MPNYQNPPTTWILCPVLEWQAILIPDKFLKSTWKPDSLDTIFETTIQILVKYSDAIGVMYHSKFQILLTRNLRLPEFCVRYYNGIWKSDFSDVLDAILRTTIQFLVQYSDAIFSNIFNAPYWAYIGGVRMATTITWRCAALRN